MISPRLIKSIRDHRDEIAQDATSRIRQDREVFHMARLSDGELCEWTHTILDLLPSWPSQGFSQIVAAQFRKMGRHRFETSIPLQEAVRSLQILKHTLFDFTRHRGFAQNALEIYAQEELQHDMVLLFDRLEYAVVCGYEEARNVTKSPAA